MPQHVDDSVPGFLVPPVPTTGGILDEKIPTLQETIVSSAERENTIVNIVEMLNRQHFPAVPGYDEVEDLKSRGLIDTAERYLGTSSPAEMDWKIKQVEQEDANRRIRANSGWTGFVTDIAAGALSPTTAIPFLRAATGAKSVLLGGVSIFAGAAADEAVLYANQQTRTGEEVALSLGASTILGGILGGLAHTLSKADFDSIVKGMDTLPDKEYVSPPVPMSHDLGAMETVTIQDVGKLREGVGAGQLSKLWITQNPILRGIQQWNAPAFIAEQGGSTEVRKITSALSQDNLALADNVDWKVASPGGNVEDLKKTYGVIAYKAHTAVEEAFVEYAKVTKGFAQKLRANLTGGSGKMNFDEFKRAISLDLWSGMTRNVDPAVRKAAQALDRDVFQALYKEGVEVGIYDGTEKVVGDVGYASRIYNDKVIIQRKQEFIDLIGDHYRRKLEMEFVEANEKISKSLAKDAAKKENWLLTEDQVAQKKTKLTEELATAAQNAGADVLQAEAADKALAKTIAALVREQKTLKSSRVNTPGELTLREGRLAEIDEQLKLHTKTLEDLREVLGDEIQKYRETVRDITRNLDELKKAFVSVERRMEAKYRKIEAEEEKILDTLVMTSKKFEKFRAFAATATDEKLDAALFDMRNSFEDAAQKFDNVEESLIKFDRENIPEVPFALIDKQGALAGKMSKLAEQIENLENLDRNAWAAEFKSIERDMLETQADIIAKRTRRLDRLMQQAEALGPEARAKRLAALEEKMKDKALRFREHWRMKGAVSADDIVVNGATANFDETAREAATEVVNKILGNDRRLAYNDLMQNVRGVELARVLDIPSEVIQDFLETDIEKIIAVYTRTLGADISLARVFGSVIPDDLLKKVQDEADKMSEGLRTAVNKDGTPRYVGEALAAENEKLQKFYAGAKKDIGVLLERVRGVRGLPKDPEAWSYRAARLALDLSYLRLMGSVLISSVPDVARIVQRQGMKNTFEGAIRPLINNFKALRLSQQEAKNAGTALDVVMHTRMYSMMDIFDDAHRGTAIERGSHFLTSRMGQWALIDQWNSAIKQITAGVVNTRILNNLAIVMKAESGNEKKAIEFLARNNIDQELAEIIWREVTNGEGGGKVNGMWLPNTEMWNVADPQVARARRAYRAALAGEVDATIVTPGLGKPNWVDANVLGRLLAQFKSYGLVSTQKVLMANLQQHDASTVVGLSLSLGLGMMAYYFYAVAAGGQTYKEMQEADIDRWLDEAIARSGQLGIGDELQRLAQKLPVLKEYASFSGKGSTRRADSGLTEAALGPTFDLLTKATRAISTLDQPTKSTLHQLRLMLPFQNLFYIRQLLDKVEAATPLPARR